MPPFLHFYKSSFYNNLRFIPGSFDIGRWFRAIDIACEYVGEYDRIVIKRGDPMCYVRFNTPNNKKIKLVRIRPDKEIEDLCQTTTSTKEYVPGLSLETLYKKFLTIRRKKYIDKLRIDR